jgi:hypothetical protein
MTIDGLSIRLGIITEGIADVRAEALLGRRVLRFSQKIGIGELNLMHARFPKEL